MRREAAEKRALSAVLPTGGGGGAGRKAMYFVKPVEKGHKAPVEKAYIRAVKAITDLDQQQGEEKKLHKQYLDSLEVVLKQKREQEDTYMDQHMGSFRQQLRMQVCV